MITPRSVPLVLFLVTGCTLSGATACSTARPEPRAPSHPAPLPAAASPAVDESEKAAAPEAEGGRSLDSAPAPAAAPPAGAGLPRSMAPRQKAREETSDDVEALGDELERTLSLSAPDCTTAWSLRDRICDLSRRLCDLAGRSAEPDVVERCTDGRGRCERATSRVRAACAE